MIASLETKFIQALDYCRSLVKLKGTPSNFPCKAIELLCEVGQYPSILLDLIDKHTQENQQALVAIHEYARSADNWRVKSSECSLGFGVKDHCTILSFLLAPKTFTAFTGNFKSPEKICEFLQDWKGIDLKTLLFQNSSHLVTDSSPSQ
jgi:hypothetical protein